MSRRVQIDYHHIAIECNNVCNMAENRLKELDNMIAQLEQDSSEFLNEQTNALKASIEREKQTLLQKIQIVRQQAEKSDRQGVVSVEEDVYYRTEEDKKLYRIKEDAIQSARELEQLSNSVASKKVIEFQSLQNSIQRVQRENLEKKRSKFLEITNGAERRLKELDNMIAQLEKNASQILNDKSNALKASIRQEKQSILEKIQALKHTVEVNAMQFGFGRNISNYKEQDSSLNDAIKNACKLEKSSNEIASKRPVEFQSLIQTLLKESLEKKHRTFLEVTEGAEKSLKELDSMIAQLEKDASDLLNDQSNELKASIEKEKQSILEKIQTLKHTAEVNAQQEKKSTHSENELYRQQNDAIKTARKLEKLSNDLASKKLTEFQSLIQKLREEELEKKQRKLLERENGCVSIDEDIQKVLDNISDSVLKQFIYLAYIQDNTLTGEELLQAGQSLMNDSLNATYEEQFQKESDRIQAELKDAKVSQDTIEKIMSTSTGSAQEKLIAMQEAATTEILGEKLRKQSLKIIKEAIQKRGFIIDNKNIKIDREKNEVKMIAQKVSGERAEFTIFMDGKFIYDFHHGYRGQACQKDIKPFMKDLEEVYGIQVTKVKEIWSNPDKISTMKYAEVNTNKNKV